MPKVFVLKGCTGEWGSYEVWTVSAFSTLEKAEAWKAKCDEFVDNKLAELHARAKEEDKRFLTFNYFDVLTPQEEADWERRIEDSDYLAWEEGGRDVYDERRAFCRERMKGINPYDPDVHIDETLADDYNNNRCTRYFILELDLDPEV